MEWTGFDWTTSAYGPEQVEVEVDQISYLSGTCVTGSRPVGDHILEREEHCQEQEDSLPKNSTTQVQVEEELDCSPGRIETSAATWVGTGSKSSTVQNEMHPQHYAKIPDKAQGPPWSIRTL